MRIAQLAPLWNSVPPATYGGIELMVHLLTEELVQRGHDVTLFASGDSRTSARLRAVCEVNLTEAAAGGRRFEYQYYANLSMSEALRQAGTFDLIHSHVGTSVIPLSALSETTLLHTIHTGLFDRSVFTGHPDLPIVAISRDQLQAVGVEPCKNTPVIHYGCDFSAYDFSAEPGKYLAFLGRMGPHKSPLDAIRIARTVGMPLVLAGSPASGREVPYFEAEVKPLIDGEAVRYIGPVDHAQKNELLKHASALLFPIRWPEPFGMVMIEAMACGTPVIACKTGSVGEVVDVGVTGVYAETADGLPSLVLRTLALDRRRVREHAMRRFSHTRMVADYLELYASLVERRTAMSSPSHSV
jgi:glycosyltransferase involved in cell wall biosynthesis